MFPMKYFTRHDGLQTTSQMNAERPELLKGAEKFK